jgi:sortase A
LSVKTINTKLSLGGAAARQQRKQRTGRWVGRLLIALGCLLVAAGLAYAGLIAYLTLRESASPSTSMVLRLSDGTKRPLVQPTPPQASAQLPPQSPGATYTSTSGLLTGPDVTTSTIKVASQARFPPLSLKAPAFGLNWPVVLGTNDSMPKFKGVGWLLGSGYPGVPGNMVLFGHLDGPNATFGRLYQLRAGDILTVTTEIDEYHYRVSNVFETTPDDVGVLTPTSGATATFITCSGQWDPARRTYSRRLIVTADLVAK